MARIDVWTRNGDMLPVETNDPAVIERWEKAPFDDAANISRVDVAED